MKNLKKLMFFSLLLTTIIAFSAMAAEWGEWQALDDQQDRGIDYRVRVGTMKFDGDTYSHSFQFRSRYDRKVKFKLELVYVDDKGTKTHKNTITIRPNAESSTDRVFARRIVSVAITRPEAVQ